jgi:hypothetical protein
MHRYPPESDPPVADVRWSLLESASMHVRLQSPYGIAIDPTGVIFNIGDWRLAAALTC